MRRWAFSLEHPRMALLVLAVALLSTAGAIGLLEPTETRYAEIAREMRASGDYLVPRLDGIPHFHKPPLAYWAATAGFAALGENGWGARVPAVLATLAAIAFASLAARRRFGALGIPPGLVAWTLGTSLLVVTLGRALASDPFLAAAVAGFWALAPSPLALAMLGVGFLAKGPVVLVPTVLPVLLASAWGRDRRILSQLGPAWGWALFALIALPWYLIVAALTHGLLDYLLRVQLWERYATTVHQRGGPPWYFAGVLLAGGLPWTAALIGGLARAWRERARPEALLLVCWLIGPLVFFSFSGSKLPAYLLPCLPAAALLCAWGLAGGGRVVRGVTAALLAAGALAGWIAGPAAFGRLVGLEPPRPVPLPYPAHLALVCMAYAATWAWRGRPARAALVVLIGWTALLVALAPYEGALGSPRPLARVLAENRSPGEPVVEYARFNAGLPFYLRERVHLLEVAREAEFEDVAGRAAVFVTRDSLPALAAAGGRLWLLGPERSSADLADAVGLRYQAVARGRHEALGLLTP